MEPMYFYYGLALALAVVSYLVVRTTSPYSRMGGGAYEWRRFLRLSGKLLFVAAILLAIIGAASQFSQNGH